MSVERVRCLHGHLRKRGWHLGPQCSPAQLRNARIGQSSHPLARTICAELTEQNSIPFTALRTAAEERGELTAVFAVQSDLFNSEGRKDKRKQKHCWSLSTGRA